MKYLPLTTIVLIHLTATSQSPYLYILVKMDSAKTEGITYKIEMKICEPKKMTERGDWFTHDTSKINFAALKPTDLKCGDYIDKGLPTLISGQEEEKPINQFEFGNQFFAWEHILIYKISSLSSGSLQSNMYIVIPVKYKSFRTRVDISDIEFQPGKVIFLTDLEGQYGDKELVHSKSLKKENGIPVRDFPLRSILEK